jgi:hypothetical protein
MAAKIADEKNGTGPPVPFVRRFCLIEVDHEEYERFW